MKTVIRNQVFNAFKMNATNVAQGTNPSGRSSCLLLPEHWAEWADDTEWQFVLHGFIGTAPTALALTAQFEKRITNYPVTTLAGGVPPEEEFHQAPEVPTYEPITDAARPDLLPAGDWPTTILNYPTDALATPKIVSNRIAGGFRHRVRLGWSLTGGDGTTYLLISCTTVMRG